MLMFNKRLDEERRTCIDLFFDSIKCYTSCLLYFFSRNIYDFILKNIGENRKQLKKNEENELGVLKRYFY
jgi:hypothetical protein